MHIFWWILAGLLFWAGAMAQSDGKSGEPQFIGAAALVVFGYLHLIASRLIEDKQKPPDSPSPPPDVLPEILAELKWQRQQKEKEIARAKASQRITRETTTAPAARPAD